MYTVESLIERKGCDVLKVDEGCLIIDVVKELTSHKIGAALVTRDGKEVGIWTERDLMRNIIRPDFDIHTATVGDYMSTNLKTVESNISIYSAMDRLLGLNIRHLLVMREGQFITLISMGDLVRACLTSKSKELDHLNSILSWEYYEQWKHLPTDDEKHVR